MPTNKNVSRLFLVTVALYLGASFLIGRVVTVPLSINERMILSQLLVLLPAVLYCLIFRVPVKEWIPFRKMKFSVWVLVVVATYLMYPLLIVLNALTLFFVKSGTAELTEMVWKDGLLAGLFLMAVVPAVVEEFLFRGVLFSTYRKSKVLPAIFLSAFLFGCMHLNLNQFLYAFVLGIYMAFLIEATGSIFSSMLAHFTINGTSAVVSYLLPKLTEVSGGMQGAESQLAVPADGNFLASMDETSLMFLALGVAIWGAIAIGTTAGAAGIYIAIAKISGRWEHVKTMWRQGTRERLLSVPVVLAAVMLLAVMVMTLR